MSDLYKQWLKTLEDRRIDTRKLTTDTTIPAKGVEASPTNRRVASSAPGLFQYIPYKPSLQYRAVTGRKEDEEPLVRAWIRGQVPALRESVEAERAFGIEAKGRAEQKRQFGETIKLRREQQAEAEKQAQVGLGLQAGQVLGLGTMATKGLLWGKTATGTGGAFAGAPVGLAVNAPEAAAAAGAGGLGAGIKGAAGAVAPYALPAMAGFGLGATIGKSGFGRDVGEFLMGQHGGRQEHAAVTGGLLGAGLGFAIGGPVGAVIGGIGGVIGGGCIIFGYLYGDNSSQARYAKVFCGRHMDLSTLLGYYQLGEKIILFWEKHPAFIRPMERLFVRPFYDYMLWKLKRKKKISLWAKVWSAGWLKLCKQYEKKRKKPIFIPNQYGPCIQAVGGQNA